MLNKKEKAVMLAILNMLKHKKSCLVTINQIFENIDVKYKLKEQDIEKIIDELVFDGYIECVVSVNEDKTYYCISLLKKGDGYYREEQQSKRSLINKIVVTICAAILSFIITLILKAIF